MPITSGGSGVYNFARVPRKFKKKWKHILDKDRYTFLTLNQKLWYIKSLSNPNYNRFIIKKTIEKYDKIN